MPCQWTELSPLIPCKGNTNNLESYYCAFSKLVVNVWYKLWAASNIWPTSDMRWKGNVGHGCKLALPPTTHTHFGLTGYQSGHQRASLILGCLFIISSHGSMKIQGSLESESILITPSLPPIPHLSMRPKVAVRYSHYTNFMPYKQPLMPTGFCGIQLFLFPVQI